MDQVLITGGAGFIGSHLCDRLLEEGHRVRVLDSLVPQVHGPGQRRPDYLSPEVELLVGDVRDPRAVREALAGVDRVVHLAAAVGVGQSMYEIARYARWNTLGTAVLLEALSRQPVRRLVVASSMSIYGEGLYRRADGAERMVAARDAERLRRGEFDVYDEEDGEVLQPIPTPERKLPGHSSVYALTKYDQERLCLMVGEAYDIPTAALRFFNVFGTRQALSNPYTGVLANFITRYVNGSVPIVFEDGRQMRDFVHVRDVAEACRQALFRQAAVGGVFNVGSGTPRSILHVAQAVGRVLGKDGEPRVLNEHRVGDIRNCYADLSLSRERLAYEPRHRFEEGLAELAEWLEGQTAEDHVEEAHRELLSRGLAV